MRYSTEAIRREAQRMLKAAGATRAPISLRDVVSYLNLSLVERRREPFGSEAALVPLGDGHAIELRGTSGERRLRFTIAHEIGHFLLHQDRAVTERGGATNRATARLRARGRPVRRRAAHARRPRPPGGARRRRRRSPPGRPLRRQRPGHEPAPAPSRPGRAPRRPAAALARHPASASSRPALATRRAAAPARARAWATAGEVRAARRAWE